MRDTVLFGSYEQDGDASGNSEPIEWLVLEVNDHDALLLSKKALGCHAYHDVNEEVTWESCTLRQWLNGSFMDSAFTAAERENILPSHVEDAPNPSFGTPAGNATEDYVYLLSIGEAERYLPEADDRFCVPTVCAMDDGPLTSSDYLSNGEMSCDWWLRSPGYSGNCAADVYVDGYIYAEGLPVDSLGCVRPVTRVCYPLNVKKTEEVKTSTPVPQVTIQPTLVPTATPAPTNTPTPQPTNAINVGTNDFAIGDIVTFGTYPQTAEGNDDTPIEWIVLDKNGDEYLLISKSLLDFQKYNLESDRATWEICSLRKWLNNEFYSKAFNVSEKEQIVDTIVRAEKNPFYPKAAQGNDTIDKVFLLSINEAQEFFKDDASRSCYETGYSAFIAPGSISEHEAAIAGIVYQMAWVLRSCGQSLKFVTYVSSDGSVNENNEFRLLREYYSGFYIRPCIWVRDDSNSLTASSSVTNVSQISKPTNTPKPTATPRRSTSTPKSTKNAYGTLKIDAGTNIRSGSSTNSSVVLTTTVSKTYKYVSCENGWYKLILDDGSYAYVYYTRAMVVSKAPGDDGSYGITVGSGSSSGSSGSSGSGSGGSSGGGGSGSGSGGGGGSNPSGGGDHGSYWVSEATPVNERYHQLIEYDWYWSPISGQYQKSASLDAGLEYHTFSNGVCTKCGYGSTSTPKAYVPYSTTKHIVKDKNGNESYENHNIVDGRCSACGYVPNPDFSPWQPNYDTEYEQKDAQSHWKISFHYEGTETYHVVDSKTEETHTFSNGTCSKCGYTK